MPSHKQVGCDSVRAWLVSLSTIMASPISRDAVACEVLERIEAFCPSKQSALFCMPDFTTDAWNSSTELEVAAARGAALPDDQAIWVERIARESLGRCQVFGRESRSAGLASFLWVPVLCRGQRVGVLQLGDDQGHAMAGSLPRELGVLADEIGAVLVHAGEHEAMQREKARLELRIDALEREQKIARSERCEQAGRDLTLNAALHRAEDAATRQPELAALASDLRELRCGESAPETWVDLRDLVDRCLEGLSVSDVDRSFLAVQADRIPPVRCQRMRVEGLLGALIERALVRLGGGDLSGWIHLRAGARTVLCEVGVEGEVARASGKDASWQGWFDNADEWDAAVDLAEDQGGELTTAVADDRTGVVLTLPVDPDLG
ncbi:MAG: hypothetical protein QF570_18135 [Myxococcota bacterium]|nr:hypothetical protein [Myxococcota bacterium]